MCEELHVLFHFVVNLINEDIIASQIVGFMGFLRLLKEGGQLLKQS
jgi:hypothetical protein